MRDLLILDKRGRIVSTFSAEESKANAQFLKDYKPQFKIELPQEQGEFEIVKRINERFNGKRN